MEKIISRVGLTHRRASSSLQDDGVEGTLPDAILQHPVTDSRFAGNGDGAVRPYFDRRLDDVLFEVASAICHVARQAMLDQPVT